MAEQGSPAAEAGGRRGVVVVCGGGWGGRVQFEPRIPGGNERGMKKTSPFVSLGDTRLELRVTVIVPLRNPARPPLPSTGKLRTQHFRSPFSLALCAAALGAREPAKNSGGSDPPGFPIPGAKHGLLGLARPDAERLPSGWQAAA